MADHDEEALLHEDLDLDYEVDEELPEDELLGDTDEYILSETENAYQEHQDVTENDEAHTTIPEQEDDVLELTEDAGIEEFEDDRFNQTQESDSESTKERGRFLIERTNTSGHIPIVFASEETEHGEASEHQQPLFTQNYLRGQGNKSRGVRGGFRGFRGGFQPRGGRLSNRLGQRFPFHPPNQQQQGNPNLHILSQNMEPIETKKVLINPHFRGNVQANQNTRLVWDNPQVPPHNMQNQNFQQTFQNVGNFSSPIMQQQQAPQQFGLMQQPQLYNHQFPEQFIPQQQVDYNNQGIPPQQQMFPQQNSYQQPINNNLGPMFMGTGQPPHMMNQQLETPGTPVQSSDWYHSNQGLEVGVQQEPFHFKQPMQIPFRHRAPRPMHPRFQQPQTIIRTIHTPQVFNPPNLGYQNPNIRPQMYQQQPSYDQQFQQYPNYQFQSQPQYQPQQNFVPNPEPPHQRSEPQFNRTINMPRSPTKRSPHKRTQTQYEYEIMNDLAAKKKKSLDFRNLQELPRIDDVPDTTVFFEDRSPMKYVQEVEEEEDEETKAYRLKIEEQRQLREKILKQKEERRKRAAMEQQQAEAAQGIQCANTCIGSTTDVSTTSIVQGISEQKPVQKFVQTPKPLMQTPVLKPLMQRLPHHNQQRQRMPQQTPERVLVPVANTQPSKSRVVLLNQTNQNKKSPLLTQQIRQKALKKQIMPNTVSSTQQAQQLTAKRVVRAIPRQGGVPIKINTVEASSSSATDVTSAESSDELFDKEHLSQFLSTRTVVPKNGTMAAASANQVTSTNVIVNGAIASTSTLLKTSVIKINNLAASTNEMKIRKMCKGVGIIQTIQMSPNLGQAVIRFKSIGHAHNFYKKYQRKMVDLSLLDVKLIPPP